MWVVFLDGLVLCAYVNIFHLIHCCIVFVLVFVFCKWRLFYYIFVDLGFFFFKQKTAYEMRISDWSSDVCSSDLCASPAQSAALSTSSGSGANINTPSTIPTTYRAPACEPWVSNKLRGTPSSAAIGIVQRRCVRSAGHAGTAAMPATPPISIASAIKPACSDDRKSTRLNYSQ